jgi:hypothetical protein
LYSRGRWRKNAVNESGVGGGGMLSNLDNTHSNL